jgi:DNA-binding transcriptional MocR family regulator
VLKGEDIIVLLKLSLADEDWTVRSLAEETGIPRSGVHRALKRLAAAGLFDERRRRVSIGNAEEFLLHAVRYLLPPERDGESRGVPTAWAAEPLASRISSSPDELPPVWPDARGRVRGLSLRPLHAAAPEAARRDPAMGELLALVDALRIGDARVRGVAARLISARLDQVAA